MMFGGVLHLAAILAILAILQYRWGSELNDAAAAVAGQPAILHDGFA